MRSETADRIRACSKLYGQQIDAKDIGQLQEMATAIGINDQDTMFLLLLVLQSHFKNLSINNFPISLPESDEGSSKMRESQVS